MAGEIEAMRTLEEALEALDEGARSRVLQWAWSRFGSTPRSSGTAPLQSAPTSLGNTSDFATFAELFDAASPTIERDKALVAAYWAQICQGQQTFQSQSLNNDLKDLGHGVGNITEALTQLKAYRPALILQLKKSGLSKQARKTYKLTEEGARRVRRMISKEED